MGAIFISLTALAILIYQDKSQKPWLKAIPGPIIVVIMGIVLNEYWVLIDSNLAQNSPQLVRIPKHENLNAFFEQTLFPNWHAWKNPLVYFYAFMLTVVASLESLINLKAAEKLDKKHRTSSKDRELLAQVPAI